MFKNILSISYFAVSVQNKTLCKCEDRQQPGKEK